MPGRPRKPPTRIILTRHGQTESNRLGLFCGHSETQLTSRGRDQARALGRRLETEPIAACYTSDFSRAIETAAIALAGRGIPHVADAALREIHYGEWEMRKERAVAREASEQYRLMRAEDPRWHPPGGENVGMVRERMAGMLDRISRKHAHETVLVVTHGTAIHCLVAEVLAVAPTHVFRFHVANCGLSEVHIVGGKPVLVTLNETRHLLGLETAAE